VGISYTPQRRYKVRNERDPKAAPILVHGEKCLRIWIYECQGEKIM